MTPLKGVDSQVYALAQGNILVGGAGASAGGSSVQVNQLNGGRITNGAVIERELPSQFGVGNTLICNLTTKISAWRSKSLTPSTACVDMAAPPR